MKKSRIINAAAWLTVGMALIAGVCIQWSNQGAGIESLIAAMAFYGVFVGGFGFCTDEQIRSKYSAR